MLRSLPKILNLVACALAILLGGFVLWNAWHALGQMDDIRAPASIPEPTRKSAFKDPLDTTGTTSEGTTLVGLDEIFVNVGPEDSPSVHSLGFRLELELFGEQEKSVVEQRQSGIKDTIIQAAREQKYDNLNTLTGKLHFKEILVSRINEFLNQPAVREIHISSFYLQ